VLVMYTGGVLGAVFWLVRVRSFTLLLFCVMVVVSFDCSQEQFLGLRDWFVADIGRDLVSFSHLTGVFTVAVPSPAGDWRFEFMLSGRCAVSSPASRVAELSALLFGVD